MTANVVALPVREHFKFVDAIKRGKPIVKLCHAGPWGDLVVAECRSRRAAEAALTEWQIAYPDLPVVR